MRVQDVMTEEIETIVPGGHEAATPQPPPEGSAWRRPTVTRAGADST
jgi:hypothetical protein